MKKILLLSCIALIGCSEVKIKANPVHFEPMTVPEPRPLNLQPIQWKVYNANDIKKLSDSLNGQKARSFLLFGLDNTNYTVLDTNIQDMFRYILEMQATKDFYKNLELNKVPKNQVTTH